MAYEVTAVSSSLVYRGHFREFESLLKYKFVWGLFACAQIDLRKRREPELATLDEKSTGSGIAEPYAR